MDLYKKQYRYARNDYREEFINKSLSLQEKRELNSYHSMSKIREHEEENATFNFGIVNNIEFSQKIEMIMDELNSLNTSSNHIMLNDEYKDYFYDAYAQLLKNAVKSKNILEYINSEEFKSDILSCDLNIFFDYMKKDGFSADYITRKTISKMKLEKRNLNDLLFKDYDVNPPQKYDEMNQNLTWMSNPNDIDYNFAGALYNVGIAKGKNIAEAIAYANARMYNYSEKTELSIAEQLTTKQIEEFFDFIYPKNDNENFSDLF